MKNTHFILGKNGNNEKLVKQCRMIKMHYKNTFICSISLKSNQTMLGNDAVNTSVYTARRVTSKSRKRLAWKTYRE